MNVIDLLKKDIIRYNPNYTSDKTKLRKISIFITTWISHGGFRAVFFYRILRNFYINDKKYLYNFFKLFELILSPIEISVRLKAGHGLLFPHPQCIVIGGGSLGNNVAIFQGVTIGLKKNLGEYPTIGDNVQLGAGSKILGNVTIGDNSRTGANSVVLKDVPQNSVAIGIPATIIRKS